jgi:hypothetical protein
MKRSAVKEDYPPGTTVMYRNPGRRGDGNIAEISRYLVYEDEKDRLAAVMLQFRSGAFHFVTLNQLKKYYTKISA